MSARSNQVIKPTIKEDNKNSSFQCMTEVFEDGKIIHYLYNPTETETLKAWKKSEECVK